MIKWTESQETYDVLEGQGLGLEQEEIRQDRGSSVTAEEDVTESVADTVVGVRGQETNQEVAFHIKLANLSRAECV